MIIDMTPHLRKMGMIWASPSLWHRMWQIIRLTGSKWAKPFMKSASSRSVNTVKD